MPLRFFTLLALTFLAVAQSFREKRIAPVPPGAEGLFQKQTKIAVVVGVGNYPEASGLRRLDYATKDARDVALELTKQGYTVRLILDAEASRALIIRTLTQLANAFDPNQGTFLFYYSGHGFKQNETNELATYGVNLDDVGQQALPLDEVQRLAKATRAKRLMLWIDACRNNANPGVRGAEGRSFAQLNAAEGIRMLLSTREGSESFEDQTLAHGVFTYFLLRGLRGDAVGSDGLITFQDLATQVIGSMIDYSVKTGRDQKAFQKGEASGDFLVAKSVAKTSSSVARTADPPGESTFGLKKIESNASSSQVAIHFGPGKPGEKRVNPSDGLTYLWISPGTFVMGCLSGDLSCRENEKPSHSVTITHGFWLGQTEATQAAYVRLMGSTRSVPLGDQLPANLLNWNDAKEFCQAAGGRLPTEAEWEYAAQAGAGLISYGDPDAIAWYGRNSQMRIQEVGTKQPNPWGLYDMLGNVGEWVADWESAYSFQSAADPKGPSTGVRKVIKGGNWATAATAVRPAYRDVGKPDYMGFSINGARCVKE